MREIKFRAWESLTSTLWQPHEIEVKFINNSHNVAVPRGDGYATYHQFENSPHPLILMQYTRLKDKNDVEIYEGDILEGFSVYPTKDTFQSKTLGEVYYSNRGTWDYCSFLLGDINEQMEVIGNIYDNPELMGKKK